jgi:uncharacterized SAM-binding protein YcdF (DUF218 family)
VNFNRRLAAAGIVVIALTALVLFFRDPVLYAMGAILTSAAPPQKADIAVVLAGDAKGNRILTAARLFQQGYVPKVLVSGPAGVYGYFESDLAIGFAVRHGFPADGMIGFHHSATSTRAEAQDIVSELRRLGVHKYLLVTSDYHTARAGRIFRRSAPDLEEHTISAPDPDWDYGRWWTNREGRKLWFNEMAKTIADYLGI